MMMLTSLALGGVNTTAWPSRSWARRGFYHTEYGSIHFPHQDYEQGRRHLTVLYYANAAWPPHFGGETLFLTPDHDPVHAVAPRPGRVVAFRGYIHHQVGIPSRHCEIARLTTVFRLLSVATGTGNT